MSKVVKVDPLDPSGFFQIMKWIYLMMPKFAEIRWIIENSIKFTLIY